MKNIIRVFIGGIAGAASTSFGADIWHTSTIKSLYPQSDGSWVLIFTVDAPACTSPVTPKYHYVIVGLNGVTAEGDKKMYAAAMMAKAADKPVTINFSDSTTSCAVNRLLVD